MQIKNIRIDPSLKELTAHRTVLLPIACYETTIHKNIYGYIPLHWHDEIQFVRVVKGEAVFQINEEKVTVHEGDGLFINSGCLHSAEDQIQSGCIYICMNVSPHFVLSQELYAVHVAPYIRATNFPYFYIDSRKTWGKMMVEAITEIKELIRQKSPFFEIDISIQLSFIWKSLISNGSQLEYDLRQQVKNDRMKQMLDWIHVHYVEKIALDDIANAGQLSRSECCRYFNRMLNTTPLGYVMEYRIQKSLVLLQDTELNITEVAYRVGFNSTSYFIDQFRRLMKMTPLKYKKSKVAEGEDGWPGQSRSANGSPNPDKRSPD